MATTITELLRDRRLGPDVYPVRGVHGQLPLTAVRTTSVATRLESAMRDSRILMNGKPQTERTVRMRDALPRWSAPVRATLSDAYASDPAWLYERTLDGRRCLVFHGRRTGAAPRDEDARQGDLRKDTLDTLDRAVLDPFVADGETIFFRRGLITGGQAAGADISGRICVYLACTGNGAAYRESDTRGGDWLKFTCTEANELLIGGYTESGGGRPGRGALLLGYFSGSNFRYAGRIGTGFDEATLSDLGRHMRMLEQRHTPFVDYNDSAGDGTHWLKPQLTARADLVEWARTTAFGHNRRVATQEIRGTVRYVRESRA